MGEKTLPETKKIDEHTPVVCKAVRTVGIIKPEFDLGTQNFTPPKLKVLGSGFWLKKEKVFVTCAHVVQGYIEAPIEFVGLLVVGGNSAPYLRASIETVDTLHDLAVLKVTALQNFIDDQAKNGLDIVDKNYAIGTRISYAGFPMGNQLLNQNHSPSYSEGLIGNEIIENEGRKLVQISGPIIGGYSGGPIVIQNEPDKVIAIVSNSPSKEAGDASIFMGIHWKHIKAIADLSTS